MKTTAVQAEMRALYNQQERRRKTEGWLPSMRSQLGDEVDNYLDESREVKLTPVSGPDNVKRMLPGLIDAAMRSCRVRAKPHAHIKRLDNLRCPTFISADESALRAAHRTICKFIPKKEQECFDACRIVHNYCKHWRPTKVKVIVLAESHANTPHHLVVNGPVMDESFLPEYDGPREFVKVVTNIGYGEPECLTGEGLEKEKNKGTPQYWELLYTLAWGYSAVASGKFASEILKEETDTETRVANKYNTLCSLRDRGVWLVDTSIFGWYISQPVQFVSSNGGAQMVKKPKAKPDHKFKGAALVVSWELFTKHLIREAVEGGNLKAIMPIGKFVLQSVTPKRLNEVISHPKGKSTVIERCAPAPNAMLPGGYGPILKKLSDTVDKHAK